MRELNIKDYTTEGRNGKGEVVSLPYPVKDTLIGILFNPQLQLAAKDLLNRDDLARKVRDCKTDTILLEESEYQQILNAVNSIKGYGRADIDFVRRVLECPQIDVEKK